MTPGVARLAVRAGAGLAIPAAVYYVLRGLGMDVYLALLISALVSALPALASLTRHRRLDGLSTYFTAMVLGGLAVSLVPGSTRVLMAKDAVMTGVTGVWFLAGTRARRPLSYLFTRPLFEGRRRWPSDWERLWQVSPRFRHMWRVSSALWGVGLLTDAGLRVLFAITLRPDLVPALGTGLNVATLVILNVGTHIYYMVCGIHDSHSLLRRGTPDAAQEGARSG